jgi:hypothetical protein
MRDFSLIYFTLKEFEMKIIKAKADLQFWVKEKTKMEER